ncbi:MAG: Gfo/Idh/MocA family oxidoreductase [Spirochaetia bacterium]
MRRYRVGILGYGFIGRVHAWAHANLRFHYNLPFETEIVRVATSRPETAKRAAAELGAEWTVESTEVTEADDIDVVHICTPNNLHHAALLEAIGAGKHIYCDKPLVVSAEEASSIRRAAEASRANTQSPPAFGMTFHNRFFPATMHARRLVEQEFLGTPLSYRAAYLHSGSASPDAPLKWKLSAQAGGGVIRDLASHALDLVSWLLGDYTEVRAVTDIAYSQRPDPDDPSVRRTVDAEDNVLLVTRMLPRVSPEHRPEPIPGVIEASKVATGSEDELRVEIHGSLGALRFNTMDPHHLEIYDRRESPYRGTAPGGWTRLQTGGRYPEPALEFPSPKNAVGWLRAHLACVASFMQHVDAGTQPEPGLEDGLYIQQIIDAVDRSAASGQPTHLQ